jgi:hypothetical protein
MVTAMTAARDPGIGLDLLPARAGDGPQAPAGPRRPPADTSGRATRHVPLALGCFALFLAVLLPVFVYPRLAVLPDDPRATQVQTDPHGTVLVVDPSLPAGARVLEDVPVRVTTHVSEAPTAADDGSVVWRLATRTELSHTGVPTRVSPGNSLVNARVETVSLDRRTGEPTNCCGDRLVTDEGDREGRPLVHRGYVAWPFDVQKQAYDVWDVQLNRPRTAAFIGEEERDGLRVYRFQAVTPLEKIGTQVLPGALFGVDEASVTAETEYADTRTFWIEPATGNVVDLQEELLQQFSYRGKVVPAISANLESPPLEADLMAKTRQGAQVLPWLRGRASVVLVVAGLALIAVWAQRERAASRSTNRSASRWTSAGSPSP